MYSEEFRWPAKAVVIMFGSILLFDLIVVVPIALNTGDAEGFAVTFRLLGLTTVVLCLVMLLFGKLTASIDPDSIVVGFGPFKDRIRFDDIQNVASVKYRFRDFGGWGIRLRPGAKMYNVPGDGFRAVEITTKKNRRILFSSKNPEGFLEAVRTRVPSLPLGAA